MKTLKSITRISTLSSAVVMSLCLMQQAQAAGICTPINGIKQFNIPFSKVLSKPSDNMIGQIETEVWNLVGNVYTLKCDCSHTNSNLMGPAYISSKTSLQLLGPKSNGGMEYKLNDYLAVSADVFIGGGVGEPRPLPLEKFSNRQQPGTGSKCGSAAFSSGAQGTLYLRFITPFTGVQTIPDTELFTISIAADPNEDQSPVAASVHISGTVTVPQSCSFDPSPITINFGEPIYSNDFKVKGEKPNGFTEAHRTITLNCQNISEGVKVELTFTGEPDPSDSNLLKTNQDGTGIAIRIDGRDKNGERVQISPTEGHLPVNIDYNNGDLTSQGIADIYVYPINTTGKPAAVGDFNATATVNAIIP